MVAVKAHWQLVSTGSAFSNLAERRWQKIAGDRVLEINREMQAEVEAELDVMRQQEAYVSGDAHEERLTLLAQTHLKVSMGGEFELSAYDKAGRMKRGKTSSRSRRRWSLPNLHGIEWELERLRPEYYGRREKLEVEAPPVPATEYRERDPRKYPSCWQAPFATCSRAGLAWARWGRLRSRRRRRESRNRRPEGRDGLPDGWRRLNPVPVASTPYSTS
jgi:hypothetical protein